MLCSISSESTTKKPTNWRTWVRKGSREIRDVSKDEHEMESDKRLVGRQRQKRWSVRMWHRDQKGPTQTDGSLSVKSPCHLEKVGSAVEAEIVGGEYLTEVVDP